MLRIALVALAVTLVLYERMFRAPFGTGFGDYQFFHHNWEFGRVAWARYGELPLWNPYYCAGIPDWGDPQSQIHHPLFFLSFLVGSTLALKFFVLAHAALGLAGMYVLARREHGLEVAGAALAAMAWAASGFFAWHCGTGHGGFVGFYLVPWLIVFWRRTANDVRWGVGVAGVLTAALLAGGAYVFPYMLLLIAFDTLPRLRDRDELGKALRAALFAGVLALLLGAWRLIPLLEHLRYYPRVREGRDSLSLGELLEILTRNDPSRDLSTGLAGHPYSWAEYGSYVGWAVVVLGVAGAALAISRRKLRWTVAGAALFASLAMGSFARWAPWEILKRVPVYESLQAPVRFMFAFLLFFSLLAGYALDQLWSALSRASWLPERLAKPVVPLLAAGLVALPIAVHHHEVLRGMWNEPRVTSASVAPEFQLVAVPAVPRLRGVFPPRATFPSGNVGTGYCYTGMDYWQADGLWAGPKPQVQVPHGATLRAWGRSTREIWADAALPLGGRIVFNQTWSPGWVTSSGELVSDHGRAAVDVAPGDHQVRLRYAPASLGWAALCLLSGLGLAAWLWRRNASYVLFGAGLVIAAVAYVRGAFSGELPNQRRVRLSLTTTASDYSERKLNDLYVPEHATDGIAKTEWLAPNATKSWLEVRLPKQAPVATLSLLNAQNAPYHDRAAHDVRVEVYDGDQLVRTTRARFLDPNRKRWLTVPIGAARADRVRIVIESWFGLGGGLAEVRVF